MAKPKTKMEMFDEFFKKNGYRHKADPRHAMNAEGTRPKKKEGTKMMEHGGMGKKKPKMMYGGMGKKKTKMGHGGMGKKKTMMGHGGMGKYKKPEMAHGGMANGKKHMYAGGGSVMENLTPGQRKMVMAMARDNKTA